MQKEECKRKIRPLSDEKIDEATLNNYSGYRKRTSASEPGYNDIALDDASSITSDILWYQFFTVNRYVILPGYISCSEVVCRVLATHCIRQFHPFTSLPVRHRVPSHFNWSPPIRNRRHAHPYFPHALYSLRFRFSEQLQYEL